MTDENTFFSLVPFVPYRLDISLSDEKCYIRVYDEDDDFCYLICVDVRHDSNENFRMTIDDTNYNSLIGSSIIVQGDDISWNETTEYDSDSNEVLNTCTISLGDNEVIRISSTHDGYATHHISIIDYFDNSLLDTSV